MEDNSIQLMNFNYPNLTYTTVDFLSSREFVNWGKDNKLPQFIYNTIAECSDLQSLINRESDYIKGDDTEIKLPDYLLTDSDNFDTLLTNIITDYVMFGGFVLEGIRNSKGDLVRLNYVNIMNIRIDEDCNTAFLSNKWGSWNGKNLVKLPIYKPYELQPHFIYYYRGNSLRQINPTPMWFAAMKSALVLNESRNYNLNNIRNNFSANVLISLNGTSIKSKELAELKDKLFRAYEGSDNAGKTMIINNANADGKVEITRLDSDKAADIYKNLQESSQNDLYTAFGMNPILLGRNVQTGFSKQEFAQAYALYKSTIISPIRRLFERELNKFGVDIHFNDLKIEWVEN